MDAEYIQTQCVLADGADRFGVAAVAFDQHEELLWMGNQGGHVTSYYGGIMQKYTSFQVHATQDIRQLTTIDEGILALTATALRCQIRRGIPVFTYTSANMSDMQCMLQLSPERLLMAGHQDKLIDFNIPLAKESDLVDVGENGCVMLRAHSRLVCAGDPVGKIDLRDPSTLNVEHTLDTHSGSLSDFDVQGNLLVTCGFSNRQGTLAVDRFLMVYDLRMMRAVTPIQVVLDPLYLRFLPSVSSRLAVVSALGDIQLVDTVALSEPRLCLYQIENPGAMCLTFDISTSSQAMVFGDSTGSIHLFASTTEPIFNTFSRMTEHADPVDTFPSFGIDDLSTPYSAIPLPIISTDMPLASDWPSQFQQKVYRRTPAIDPEILRTMKIQGPIGYAPNPKSTRRNQVVYLLDSHGSKVQVKLFGSESRSAKANAAESGFVAIPKRYRRVDVKYSKLGSDDFQFEQYNKTGLPGLEATLPNAYCNAMLQVLYYTEALRGALLSHLCTKEFCLSCELGFLFHMMLTSRGTPCQPANFLRAFRTVPEASALSLILSDVHHDSKFKTDLGSLIQSWSRFILHQMHGELLETKRKLEDKSAKKEIKQFVYKEIDFPSILSTDINSRLRKHVIQEPAEEEVTDETDKQDVETDISKLFGMKQLQINTCLKCGLEVCKNSILLACNLVYPSGNDVVGEWSFCDLLSSSLCPQQTTPAWCDTCEKFSPTSQARILKSLPKVLAVNTGLHNNQYKRFWQTQIDNMVAKATSSDTTRATTPNTTTTSTKQCRYGANCARADCRFRHGSSTSTPPQVSLNNLYSTNTWLPHDITMTLDENKKLIITNRQVKNEKDEIAGTNVSTTAGTSASTTAGTNVSSTTGPLSASTSSGTNVNTKVGTNVSTKAGSNVSTKPGTNASTKVGTNVSTTSVSEETETKDKQQGNEKLDVPQQNYCLTAVVCYINDQQSNEKKNIVSLIRARNPNDRERSELQWYLFNDISICQVPAQEAVWFSLDWKVPCVLYYSSEEVLNETVEIIQAITQDVFGEDKCVARSGGTSGITFTPLAANEMPKPGELVAMDAEFVTLNQEESELRSDGKMSTIKPSHMSVARITCIRGQGPLEGVPFIDDYISTQEQVVDYLTKFSGIKPGDLDANFSSKHLTTLKSTYQKLRFLQDSGVIFVGHGLKNDFRVINMVVSPEQVADTVLLFHLPHQRMVSLRFLAWHFLGLKIQSETHDSIEDARAALQLYKRYKELQAENKMTAALTELYETGKLMNWRVPED